MHFFNITATVTKLVKTRTEELQQTFLFQKYLSTKKTHPRNDKVFLSIGQKIPTNFW